MKEPIALTFGEPTSAPSAIEEAITELRKVIAIAANERDESLQRLYIMMAQEEEDHRRRMRDFRERDYEIRTHFECSTVAVRAQILKFESMILRPIIVLLPADGAITEPQRSGDPT